jgi:hypothetical protein
MRGTYIILNLLRLQEEVIDLREKGAEYKLVLGSSDTFLGEQSNPPIELQF